MEAPWDKKAEKERDVPIKFHGNPVNKNERIHSKITNQEAKQKTFAVMVLLNLIKSIGKAVNNPKNSPLAMGTKG